MFKLLVLSDVHIGSVWSPWPEGVETTRGVPIVGGKLQTILYGYWENMVKRVEGEYDILLLVGDLIDGKGAKRENGDTHLTSDLDLQRDVLVSLIEPLADGVETYVFEGTKFHDSEDMEVDKAIAKELGATYCGDFPTDFNFDGRIVNIQHGSGHNTDYRATAMDKIALSKLLASSLLKSYHADLIIRAHSHFYGYLEYAHQAVLLNPCWQYQTAYLATQKYSDKLIPDIGCTLIDVGESITPKKILYPYPIRAPRNTEEYNDWVVPSGESLLARGVYKKCLS